MNLSFYGGVQEIGGNKILLEDDGTKVFLEFGQTRQIEPSYFHFSPHWLPTLNE